MARPKGKRPRLRKNVTNVKAREIEATEVFYTNEESDAKILVNRGGARSSKSYSITQLLTQRFLAVPGRKILVLRKTLPSLRLSTYPVFINMIRDWGYTEYVQAEKTLMNYYFNDAWLHFGSLDDPEKIKSSDWNDIFLEEATEFTYEDFQILKLRLSSPECGGLRNQMFLSFNPVDEFHWIKSQIVEAPSEDSQEITSNYKMNPFLSTDYIAELEKLILQDANYHRIYAKGEWGKLENLIFSNWRVHKEVWPTSFYETVYGVDFGFNAPSAVIEIGIDVDLENIYLKEVVYQSQLTTPELITLTKENLTIDDFTKPEMYMDDAEPDRIEEFSQAGFNVFPADKAVNSGIEFMKRFALHIHPDSINLQKEFQGYAWKKDRNGRPIDTPIKFRDHGIDPSRYGIFTHLKHIVDTGDLVRYL